MFRVMNPIAGGSRPDKGISCLARDRDGCEPVNGYRTARQRNPGGGCLQEIVEVPLIWGNRLGRRQARVLGPKNWGDGLPRAIRYCAKMHACHDPFAGPRPTHNCRSLRPSGATCFNRKFSTRDRLPLWIEFRLTARTVNLDTSPLHVAQGLSYERDSYNPLHAVIAKITVISASC